MIFRNDYGSTEEDWRPFREGHAKECPRFQTSLGLAYGDDGVKWDVRPAPCWQVGTRKS